MAMPISAAGLPMMALVRSSIFFFLLWLLSGAGIVPDGANADATSFDGDSDADVDAGAVVSVTEDVTIDGTATAETQLVGRIRYHYYNGTGTTAGGRPTGDRPRCEDVVVMGVGTAMGVEDYDALSRRVAVRAPGIVFAAGDPNPRGMVKTSPEKYAALFGAVRERVGKWIPSCEVESRTTKPTNFFVGGHSASGQAALVATQRGLYGDIAPDGFVGLDPYDISSKTMLDDSPFPFPTLDWGFTETTCLVGVDRAAAGAYEYSSPTERVLYQVDNRRAIGESPAAGVDHCVFTDDGCGVGPLTVCPTETNRTDREILFDAIADSIRIFLDAVRERQRRPGEDTPFTRHRFEPPVESYEKAAPGNQIFLFVNSDEEMEEGKKSRPQVQSSPAMLRQMTIH